MFPIRLDDNNASHLLIKSLQFLTLIDKNRKISKTERRQTDPLDTFQISYKIC